VSLVLKGGVYSLRSQAVSTRQHQLIRPADIILDAEDLNPADVVEWHRSVMQYILTNSPETGPIKTFGRTSWALVTFMTACVYAGRVLSPKEIGAISALIAGEFTYMLNDHDIESMNELYSLAPRGLRTILAPMVDAIVAAWYQTEDAFDYDAFLKEYESFKDQLSAERGAVL
jgi:hypothetical protein